MNHWKYITIIMAGIGMIACQSQTEQAAVAPVDTTTPEVSQHVVVQPAASIAIPAVRTGTETTAPTAIQKVESTQVDMSALNKCKVCHHFTPKNKVGPGLGKGMVNGKMEAGDYGRTAGTHPGFHYTFVQYIPAGHAWVWDEIHTRKWICNSMQAIKEFTGNKAAKTKMPPQHVCDPAKQDAVIAALKSIS